MNQAGSRAELVHPAPKAAGSGVVLAARVRREVITLGSPSASPTHRTIAGGASHSHAASAGSPSSDTQRGMPRAASKTLVITYGGPVYQANQ